MVSCINEMAGSSERYQNIQLWYYDKYTTRYVCCAIHVLVLLVDSVFSMWVGVPMGITR